MGLSRPDTIPADFCRFFKNGPRKKKLRGSVGRWLSDVGIREIHSGAIIPDPNVPGSYLIDANTSHGLCKFRQAEEYTACDSQSEEGSPTIRSLRHMLVCQVEKGVDLPYFLWTGRGQGKTHWQSTDATPREYDINPTRLIEQIASETTTREEKRKAVIEAEVVAFPSYQVSKLNDLLYLFIEQYRNSDDQEDLVAVGSAIRKYVASMNEANLSSLAILLDANHNVTIPIEVELEVAKTLVRRLTLSPPDVSNSEPQLGDRLFEIVSTYLTPRLLSRDKVAAVALNSILALCLLRSPHADEVRRVLKELPVAWFSELVLRRASQIRNTLIENLFPQQAEYCAKQLAALNGCTISSDV